MYFYSKLFSNSFNFLLFYFFEMSINHEHLIHMMDNDKNPVTSYLLYKEIEKFILDRFEFLSHPRKFPGDDENTNIKILTDILLILETRLIYNINHLGHEIDSQHFHWMSSLVHKYLQDRSSILQTISSSFLLASIYPKATRFVIFMNDLTFEKIDQPNKNNKNQTNNQNQNRKEKKKADLSILFPKDKIQKKIIKTKLFMNAIQRL